MADESIFAMELCVRVDWATRMVPALRAILAAAAPHADIGQKREMYRACLDILQAELRFAEKGCWDFFDDHRARGEFDGWARSMVSQEGARAAPSGYDGQPRYATFTMAIVMARGTASERALSRLCDIPESELWRRETFARILGGLGAIDFTWVRSDVAYLIPRDDGWALTLQDLALPKFHYLRPIV